MKKFFNVILPDEPFKSETTLNQVVQCQYDGAKYLLIRVDDSDNKVVNAVAAANTIEELNLDSWNEEGHSFHVLDASVHPFEAAYLTHSYTHGEVENFKETLPNGDVWEYVYEDNKGIIAQIYKNIDLVFDRNSKTFSEPSRMAHGTTRESFFEGAAVILKDVTKALEENDFLPEEKKVLEDYKKFLTDLPATFANVDHWKIRFPANIPMY